MFLIVIVPCLFCPAACACKLRCPVEAYKAHAVLIFLQLAYGAVLHRVEENLVEVKIKIMAEQSPYYTAVKNDKQIALCFLKQFFKSVYGACLHLTEGFPSRAGAVGKFLARNFKGFFSFAAHFVKGFALPFAHKNLLQSFRFAYAFLA